MPEFSLTVRRGIKHKEGSNVGNSTNTPSAKPKNLQTLLDENDGAISTKDIYDQQRQAKFAKDATK